MLSLQRRLTMVVPSARQLPVGVYLPRNFTPRKVRPPVCFYFNRFSMKPVERMNHSLSGIAPHPSALIFTKGAQSHGTLACN